MSIKSLEALAAHVDKYAGGENIAAIEGGAFTIAFKTSKPNEPRRFIATVTYIEGLPCIRIDYGSLYGMCLAQYTSDIIAHIIGQAIDPRLARYEALVQGMKNNIKGSY